MLRVAKFGGSSLANATQFSKVKEIVFQNQERKVVVVSAIGKDNKTDSKMTDLLYLLHAYIIHSVPYDNIVNIIKEKFLEIKKSLNLTYDVIEEFDKLLETVNKNVSIDYIVSRGEYFTAKLISEYLNYKFIDAQSLIVFDYNGIINMPKTEENIKQAYEKYQHIVIPGFYGSYPNNEIKLLSRGGSDITGAIVAKAINASIYENWTDVSGIYVADPKIIENPQKIKEITYDELRELSYMGANVLHEETIFPVQKMNIPINILNTNNPFDEGTIITKNASCTSRLITGLSGKNNYISITITKTYHANKTEVIRKVLDVFSMYKIKIEHIPTSIDSFSIIAPLEETKKVLYDLITDLKKDSNIMDITVDEDLALVAIVGRNMINQPGVSGKIFALIGKESINIKMIAQGSHEIAIILGVSNHDMPLTIKALYKNLVG